MSILFAAQGASVGVVDINPERAAETMGHIERIGGKAIPVIADICNAKACDDAVGALVSKYGGLNVLVNNTGVSKGGRMQDMSEDEWNLVVDINMKGVWRMSVAALPHLRGNGNIINVSSIAGQIGMGAIAYSASKGGVIAMTRSMARELGPDNIRVNCLVPGHVVAPMMRTDPEYRRDLIERLMLGYQGTAWDVAWAGVYLASDESRWITAEILQIDGGSPMAGPVPRADLVPRY
jgi:NAD(P)-dependent dehydrogenase (short-subunit alcohol dehydrogenase family)